MWPALPCTRFAPRASQPAAEVLAIAIAALDAGCPKSAIETLKALMAEGAADLPANAHVTVLTLLLGWLVQTTATGLDDTAPSQPILLTLRQAPADSPPPLGPKDDVRLVGAAVRALVDPSVAIDRGQVERLARILARIYGLPCGAAQHVGLESAGAREAAAFRQTWRNGVTARHAELGALAEAMQAALGCEPSSAAAAMATGAEAATRAGAHQLAAELGLRQVEAAYFPDARAETLGVRWLDGGARADAAAAAAAAIELHPRLAESQTARWNAQLGLVAERHRRGASDPAFVSLHLRLRATAALVWARNPAEASRHARAAMAAGADAGRADLVDAAAFVLLTAAAEAGDPRAPAWADQLAQRLALRGVEGAPLHVAMTLTRRAQMYAALGDRTAVALLDRAADPFLARTPLAYRIGIWSQRASTQFALGAFEQAIPAAERALALTEDAPSLAPEAVDAMRLSALAALSMSLHALGRTAELDAVQRRWPPAGAAAREAALGVADLERALRQQNFDAVQPWLIATMADGAARARDLLVAPLCRAGAPHRRRARELAPSLAAQASGQREQVMLSLERASADLGGAQLLGAVMARGEWAAQTVGLASIRCGAVLGDPAEAEAGVSLIRRLSPRTWTDELARFAAAALSEARGDFAAAAQAYVALARDVLARRGLAPGVGTGAHQTVEGYFERATACHLRTGDAAAALQVIAESTSRDLMASRAASHAHRGRDAALAEVAAAERRIGTTQAELAATERLANAAAHADQRVVLEGRARALGSQLTELHRLREEAVGRVRQRDARAYRAAALAPAVGAPAPGAHLHSDEVLIAPILHTDQEWVIVVDRDRTTIVDLAAPEGAGAVAPLSWLLARVRALERAAQSPRSALALARLRGQVGERLLEPLYRVVPAGKRWVIVPDAAVSGVALAALGPAASPLMKRHALRVLPSLALWEDPPAPPRAPTLVIGDPALPTCTSPADGGACALGGGAWRALPGARAEATRVGELWGVAPLVGAQAAEPEVVRRMSAAGVLHFATHGLADVRQPDHSALLLTAAGRGAGQDGVLTAVEIEQTRLSGAWVILSACETGVGQQRGLQGALALDRAFLVAGASAVVSSLWVVSDASTSELMQRLHQGVQAGRPLDVALAEAMRAVRERSPDPRLWSGFQVVGAGLR